MAAFTTIAAGVGLAATVATTGMSFANAGKQKKLAAQAKADADAALDKAKKALEVNFYKQQAINKQPYELEREALLSSAAQAMDASIEAGLAPVTAGRVQMAMNAEQADVTNRMGKEMSDIDKSIISEESRLRDVGAQISLGEAEGAELARRDALEAQTLANQQGWQGVTSSIQQASQLVPLFAKNESASQTDRLEAQAERRGITPEQYKSKIAALGKVGDIDYATVKDMNSNQFKAFMQKVPAKDIKNIRQNTLGMQGFNPFDFNTYDSQHIFGK